MVKVTGNFAQGKHDYPVQSITKNWLSWAKYHMHIAQGKNKLCNFAHPEDDPVQSCP
jgi:hypothetical protein